MTSTPQRLHQIPKLIQRIGKLAGSFGIRSNGWPSFQPPLGQARDNKNNWN